MAITTISGLGSGINFSQITEAIIAQRSRPINQMTTQRATLDSRVSALKDLNAKLIALTEAARALTDQTLGTGRVASSSATDIVAATSASTAALGTLSVNVTRLATSFSQASRSYASASTAVLAGGATSATFELRKGGASSGTAITIDSSNNSLEGLRDAINAAGAGVTATIVDLNGDGTQNQLVLTSAETGAQGRVELVETTGTGTGADLNLRSLNPPGSTDYSLLDAAVTVNGLTITRPTNTISDAVSGLTLELKAAGQATVTVAGDTKTLGDKVSAFVDAYNAVQDFIAGQYALDVNGKPKGVLAGDPTLRTAQEQLRAAVSGSSTANGGAFSNLTEIGIGRDASGKLTLDQAKLDDKLKSSFSDVRALFSGLTAGQTGLANSIYAASNSLSDSISGTVQTAIKGYTDSIRRLDDSIAAQQDRIDQLRDSLTRQFAAVDAAIGQLNNQGTALSNIIKSLQPRDN
jgi:flagellar hook-associated protein 2